jgi:NADH:ubiquinone oxidoreductase subunit 6 (subunit J)
MPAANPRQRRGRNVLSLLQEAMDNAPAAAEAAKTAAESSWRVASGGAFNGLVFIFLAVVVIFSSLMVVTQKDIVRAATALFVALGATSGLYLFLGAEFLAFVQIMVYVGGTTVLIMFGVMLTARSPVEIARKGSGRAAAGIAATVMILIPLLMLLLGIGPAPAGGTAQMRLATGELQPQSTRNLGDMLLTSYIAPFIIASFVLLIALVGAAYMVRRREEPEDAEPAEA